MNAHDMARRRRAQQNLDAARISDVARLANELQAAGEPSRGAALREAERLQAKHGMGLVLGLDVDPPECPQCSGPGVFLGTLGSTDHYRCRNCGWEFTA